MLPPPDTIARLAWFRQAATRPSQVTWPLYAKEGPKRFTFVGTSVLLEVLGRHFILTAAHVFGLRGSHPIQIGTPKGIRPVYGKGAITRDPDMPPVPGFKLDLAVQLVAPELVSVFPNTAFVRQHELALYPTEVPPDTILLLGYPASIQPRRGPATAQYSLGTTHCPPATYSAMTATPEHHLLVPFTKDTNWRETGLSVAPDLYGMSGCGMWYVTANRLTQMPEARLAAQAIEWHRAPHYCLFGTKLIAPFTFILAEVGIRKWNTDAV